MSARAAAAAGLRQVLACGRVSDAVSGRGLEGFDVALRHSSDAGSGAFPARIVRKPGGWYALHLVPARQMPAPAGTGEVTLVARFTVPGRLPVEEVQVVDRSWFAVSRRQLPVGGRVLLVDGVDGAPWSVSVAVAPPPVALRGMVVRDHDAGSPAAGVSVAVPGVPPVVTDPGGRFHLPALPVAHAVQLTLTAEDQRTVVTLRPDHDRPVNIVTLSLPS